jgi:hypothetical protein
MLIWGRGVHRKLADKSDHLCPKGFVVNFTWRLLSPSVCFLPWEYEATFRIQLMYLMLGLSISHYDSFCLPLGRWVL